MAQESVKPAVFGLDSDQNFWHIPNNFRDRKGTIFGVFYAISGDFDEGNCGKFFLQNCFLGATGSDNDPIARDDKFFNYWNTPGCMTEPPIQRRDEDF